VSTALTLEAGTYQLTAKHYENNLLEYYTEENITVAGSGEYTLDLIMLPAIDEERAENSDTMFWPAIPFVIILSVALSLIILVRVIRRRETLKAKNVIVLENSR
jgi:uncharacterized membrane protein